MARAIVGDVSVFEQMPESVAIYELDGRLSYANPATCRLLGRPLEELSGEHLSRLFSDADAEVFARAFERVVARGKPEDFMHCFASLRRWYRIRLYRCDQHVCAVASDVTEERLAANRLEILADASRAFAEAAADPRQTFEKVARKVAEAVRDTCSIRLIADNGRRFERQLGLWDHDPEVRDLLESVSRRAPTEGVRGQGAQGTRPVLGTKVEPATAARYLLGSRARAIAARLGFHSVMAVPLRVDSKVVGVVATGRRRGATAEPYVEADLRLLEELADRVALVVKQWLTLRKLETREQSLRLSQRRLRAAVELRDEFLQIASHELRTPLTTLGLELESLQRLAAKFTGGVTPSISRKVATSLRQTDRLTQLVDALLNASSIDGEQAPLSLTEFDFADAVSTAIERLQSSAVATLRFEHAEPVRGRWDRARIERLLGHLLENAVKYGAGEAIDVGLAADADHVELSVRDRGMGIAARDLPRIFGRFERAVPARHYGGLGLGLYLARQIAEAHGGRISVTSSPGHGATFVVVLPRVTVSSAEVAQRSTDLP